MKKVSPPAAMIQSEGMRRFSVVLVLAAVASAASTAGAAHGVVAKTVGGTSLELVHGAGFASVRNRGTFFGRVSRGKIVGTSNVRMFGCERRGETDGGMVRCKGRRITFTTIGAEKWRVRLRGRGISGSGFVRGCLVLDGRNSGDTGSYRRGGGGWKDWPRSRKHFALGDGSC
jgi:hypothetical protein